MAAGGAPPEAAGSAERDAAASRIAPDGVPAPGARRAGHGVGAPRCAGGWRCGPRLPGRCLPALGVPAAPPGGALAGRPLPPCPPLAAPARRCPERPAPGRPAPWAPPAAPGRCPPAGMMRTISLSRSVAWPETTTSSPVCRPLFTSPAGRPGGRARRGAGRRRSRRRRRRRACRCATRWRPGGMVLTFSPALELDGELGEHARAQAPVLVLGADLDGEGAAAGVPAGEDAGDQALELLAGIGGDGEGGGGALLEAGDVQLLDAEGDLHVLGDHGHQRRVGGDDRPDG